MGFFKDVFSNPAALALGTTGALLNLNNAKNDREDASQRDAMSIYNDGKIDTALENAARKKKDYYGNSLSSLGSETDDYVSRIKGNLGKDVARADLYNQQAGQQRSLQNARAGLSGVDTSALNEQSRRNASFGASAINEDAKRSALDIYGKSVSNRIEGSNKIDNSEMALAIAQLKAPETAYRPGLIGSIFSGFV